MAYQDVVEVYGSQSLRMRVTACVAVEGVGNPYSWVAQHEWVLPAQPGWADAWASAKAAYPDDPDLGLRGDVISDAMILAAVQSIVAAEQPTPTTGE